MSISTLPWINRQVLKYGRIDGGFLNSLEIYITGTYLDEYYSPKLFPVIWIRVEDFKTNFFKSDEISRLTKFYISFLVC